MYGDLDALHNLKHAKHRPETKPIPMMVSKLEQLEGIAIIDERTKLIAKYFLPGALTLVLPVDPRLDKSYNNGLETIAIRIPDEEFVLSLIDELDTPLLVTSANQSGAPTALKYEDVLEQFTKQLNKLEDVLRVLKLKSDNSVYRELVLIKVKADAEQRAAVNEVVKIFRSKIIDVSPETLTIELTGDESKISALIKLLEEYEIKELVRTGVCALERGANDITDYCEIFN